MTRPQNWQAVAFNPATESTNQIHSDAMAKAYGYRGGLVPGVVVSGYLVNPAVSAWGKDWLERGEAKVIVSKPLYDGLNFEVQLSAQTDQSYQAQLIDEEGTLCASAEVSLNPAPAPLPILRGDPLLTPDEEILPAELKEMQRLKTAGMKSLGITWHERHKMSVYLKDSAQMPEIHRLSAGGFAHGAFLLGITNWVLAGNAYMNPWVHLQTTSRFLQAVPFGTALIAECEIKDLFSKKGHDFVDVAVNIFATESQTPVMTAELRAIYKMRPA
ncbi:MAG: acyl dehydratase [Candidatus Azotimanducaceae bacterium]|jgi:acyl dehydratase